jgi:hypothetical protein
MDEDNAPARKRGRRNGRGKGAKQTKREAEKKAEKKTLKEKREAKAESNRNWSSLKTLSGFFVKEPEATTHSNKTHGLAGLSLYLAAGWQKTKRADSKGANEQQNCLQWRCRQN